MLNLNQKQNRELVSNFYKKNKNNGKIYTVNYFLKLGISKKTIYNVIDRVDYGKPLTRKFGSGRNHIN